MAIVELYHSNTKFAEITDPDGSITLNTKDKLVDDYIKVQADAPQPTGKIDITGTAEVDVSDYATAQVVDSDLIASNIKENVDILGVTGNLHPGITPSGNKSITAGTSTQTGIDVSSYATASVEPTPTETKSVTENGTVTPTSGKYLSSVTVNVPSKNAQKDTGSGRISNNTSFTGVGGSITVAKTGTYNVQWFHYAYASGSSYYNTRLYKNGSAVGTQKNAPAYSGSSGFIATEENLALNSGDVIQVRAKSRSGSSYWTVAGGLCIQEV